MVPGTRRCPPRWRALIMPLERMGCMIALAMGSGAHWPLARTGAVLRRPRHAAHRPACDALIRLVFACSSCRFSSRLPRYRARRTILLSFKLASALLTGTPCPLARVGVESSRLRRAARCCRTHLALARSRSRFSTQLPPLHARLTILPICNHCKLATALPTGTPCPLARVGVESSRLRRTARRDCMLIFARSRSRTSRQLPLLRAWLTILLSCIWMQ